MTRNMLRNIAYKVSGLVLLVLLAVFLVMIAGSRESNALSPSDWEVLSPVEMRDWRLLRVCYPLESKRVNS